MVAERLASYFTHTAARIGGEHVSRLTERDHDNHSSVMEIRKAYKDDHFDFEILGKEQVQDALKTINPKKSCGWDPGAPPKLLKKVASGVAPSLTSLYNNCIKLSQWPTAWKKGEWTPVFKKGDRQEEKNYRPITSLVCVDKIFEHLLSKQIVGHFDSTLCQRMTAYRRQHSCQTALLTLLEEWKQTVDRKEIVTILSTDMSEAFDSLRHFLTIKKLNAYGFGSSSLDLIRFFFDKRLNRVKINDHIGESKTLERGCPKGTALRPLLWNMFQNHMRYHVNESNLTMYADDHQLYATGKTHEAVHSALMSQGWQALAWYKNNFLLANTEKSRYLSINPRNSDVANSDRALNIDNQGIKKTGRIKLLGVYMDENLNFAGHITDLELAKK